MALVKVVKLINANVSAEWPDGTLKFSGFSDFEFVAGLGTYPEVVVHRNGVLPGLVRYGGPLLISGLPADGLSIEILLSERKK